MRFSLKQLSYIFLTLAYNNTFGQIPGCTDPLANNYNISATLNDGTCTYNFAGVSPVYSQQLDSVLLEISGIIKYGDDLFAQCDEIDTQIYRLDTLTGAIQQTLSCGQVSNYNWEEIAQDSANIYIGDFGNNINGNRTDLHILKFRKDSLLSGQPVADTIYFAYSTQTNFNPTGFNNTDFDCEAFIATTDSIYLFTKEWISNKSTLYVLPNSPGTHVAQTLDTLNVQGLITGATQLEEKGLVALCGYNNQLQPFLYLLYDYPNRQLFRGNKRKININLPFHQIEGVATSDGLNYFLANEGFSNPPLINTPQKLHFFNLSAYLYHYLYPTLTADIHLPEKENQLIIYPNPSNNRSINLKTRSMNKQAFKIFNSHGEQCMQGRITENQMTLNLSSLADGNYFLKLENGSKYSFILK